MDKERRVTQLLHEGIKLKVHVPTKAELQKANDETRTYSRDTTQPATEASRLPTIPQPLLSSSKQRNTSTRPRGISHLRKAPETPRRKNVLEQSPDTIVDCLATLHQHGLSYVLYQDKEAPYQMGMLREVKDHRKGNFEYKILMSLQSQTHIIKPVFAFLWEGKFSLGLELCRHTLHEILHVHICLKEQHIQQIAKPLFEAVGFLRKHDVTHNNINLKSIRFRKNGQLVLANFADSTYISKTTILTEDLEALALVLIECMDGKPKDLEQIEFLTLTREMRHRNRVFDIRDPERWSGSQHLIDFLEELLAVGKSAQEKLDRPHRFIHEGKEDRSLLLPFLELVPIECFTSWEAFHNPRHDV